MATNDRLSGAVEDRVGEFLVMPGKGRFTKRAKPKDFSTRRTMKPTRRRKVLYWRKYGTSTAREVPVELLYFLPRQLGKDTICWTV